MTEIRVINKDEIINSIKLLIYNDSPSLLEKINFDDDTIYLEPLLFSYFNCKKDDFFSKEVLEEILQGYYINKEELKIEYSYNKNGIVYVPKRGYFKKQSKRAFLPIAFINGTSIEIIKYSHPLIDSVFKIGSDNKINENNIKFNEDVYNQNIGFLKNAFDFIKLSSKKHYDLIEQCCKKVVLFETDPENINSFATINAHGIAFFNTYQKDYDEVFFVDDITHQTGHIILTTILFKRKDYFLINENENIKIITKNKREYRSFYILFHALYTYYSSLTCLDNCIEYKCFNKRQTYEAKGRIGFYINKCLLDLSNFEKVVKHFKGIENVLTKEGIDLFNEIKNKLIEVINKWYSITIIFHYNNQPYNFTYSEFIKLNPTTDA